MCSQKLIKCIICSVTSHLTWHEYGAIPTMVVLAVYELKIKVLLVMLKD